MVMVFLDESSNFGAQGFVCVAGYIGGDDDWESFAREWRILLQKHGLASLHTADFLAGQGDYKNLGLTKPERENIVSDFIGVIRKHLPAGFGVGVDGNHFRSITKNIKKKIKPEVFCFQRVIKLVTLRLEQWKIDEPYHLFFDDVREYAIKLYSFLCDLWKIDPQARKRISVIAFGMDEIWPPLQAADLLSYATATEQRFGFQEGAWDAERSLFRPLLFDTDPAYGKVYDNEYWDAKMLEKHADAIRNAARHFYGVSAWK